MFSPLTESSLGPTQADTIFSVYVRLAAASTTVLHLRSTHGALAREITPLEFDHLHQAGSDELARLVTPYNDHLSFDEIEACVAEWLARLGALFAAAGKRRPEAFQRIDVRHTVALYTNDKPDSTKTLVVCFLGRSNFPMLDTPSFLQAFDSERTSVVLLKDIPYRGYAAGLAGVSAMFDGLVNALPTLLNFASYRRIACVGTSAGSPAALIASLRWKCDRVLLAGALSPSDSRIDAQTQQSYRTAVSATVARSGDTRATIAFGTANEIDRTAAEEIGGMVPNSTLYPVANEGWPDTHRLLETLAARGHLSSFLTTSLAL